MNRTMLWALSASTAVAGTTFLYGQGASVQLQPTTPGTQQVGNANISGRVIAGSIQAESAVPTAQVIVGNATSTSGANFGGFFRSDSVLGRALYGRASATSGTTHGVWGQADSPGGRGVTGLAPATAGNATGVWGQTASTTGRGVYGYTTATSGENYGVFGQSSSAAGYGVYSSGRMHATGVISGNGSGLTNVNASHLGGFLPSAYLKAVPNPLTLVGSQNGPIISAENTAGTNTSVAVRGLASGTTSSAIGVKGQSTTNSGVGVWGEALHTTGTNYGIRGETSSPGGTGILGRNTAPTGGAIGVQGSTTSSSGRGVYGAAFASLGTTYGVRGYTFSTSGYGVYSLGSFAASGTKSFRIDHPFDPENKYLLHYSTESPTPQNFYVGNVVTDGQGYAWIELPDYFGEINKNFKYQLTVISGGADFVQAMVSKEIQANRFQVRTSAPNTKVSWRVDADRNDLYVRNRPPRGVEEKVGVERGLLQHPEFYGFGPERGMDYDPLHNQHHKPPNVAKK